MKLDEHKPGIITRYGYDSYFSVSIARFKALKVLARKNGLGF